MEARARRRYPAQAAERKKFTDSGEALLNKPFQRPKLSETLRKALD